MARRRPVGADGGAARGRGPGAGGSSGRGKGRRGGTRRSAVRRGKAVVVAGPVAEPVSGRGAWPRAVAAVGSVAALVALDASAAVPATPLALTGAERGALAQSRAVWGWRDQALNRVWRRPGGLARMAGV